MDIQNFFPSIGFRRVMGLFRFSGYSPRVSYFLSKICTLEDELPHGSAASPAISNILCAKLDYRVSKLCQNGRFSYTRYADDIAISGSKINRSIIRNMRDIIKSEGFIVNENKTRVMRSGQKNNHGTIFERR